MGYIKYHSTDEATKFLLDLKATASSIIHAVSPKNTRENGNMENKKVGKSL